MTSGWAGIQTDGRPDRRADYHPREEGGEGAGDRPGKLPAMVPESRLGRERGQRGSERKPLQNKANTKGKQTVSTPIWAAVRVWESSKRFRGAHQDHGEAQPHKGTTAADNGTTAASGTTQKIDKRLGRAAARLGRQERMHRQTIKGLGEQ